jgi:predicted GNAT superfamily acetyltransferase
MDEGITIRLLDTLDEFRACQDVQLEAWKFPDLLAIPYTQLASAQHNGGVVLGAFDGKRVIYGLHDTPLYDQLPSDRLVIEWELHSERVLARLSPEWRAKTRLLFEHYVGRGYTVSGYASGPVSGRRRNFYLLEKQA